METFTLETPGKVNLFLKVMGRRPDSYHEIETLFFPMERITDSVSVVFTEQSGTRISCRTSGVPSDESNICWKAAELYLKTAGIETGMEIFLDKRIPVAAGMGGGSSDAAAVLLLLQKKFGALDGNAVYRIAGKIGADVPFFLNPVPSVGRGVGELLEEVPDIPRVLPLLIVAPEFPVSAPWSYRHLDYSVAAKDMRSLESLLEALHKEDFLRAASFLRNDLEYAVMEKFPLLELLKRELASGENRVMVSGSGPTLFVFYESFEARERVWEHVNARIGNYAVKLLKA